MAKKQGSDLKAVTLARIRRTEAYAEKVRLMFAKTVNDILALNKTMPTLDEGVMYSFDGESIKKQKEVEALLRRLHSAATMAIQQGISLEWEQANQECDKLIKSAFGKKVLESPEFNAWTGRNTAARDAFLNRSENGLNLSDRVWKSVRQLRDEMEVAMTVSIGEGESSSSMSRKVREYLNNPDDMFRRFRYKKGEKDIIDPETGEVTGKEMVWGKKWKKRIKDEATGKYKWIDYDRDDYKTGSGVYKSSAKNAMRVARTETNIAYRRADNARWQDMDFVLGQRVQLSKNHPRKDICDKLQGDYPKDFVFDGWHPQCFCFCTPILIDEDEMAKVTEALLRGEKYEPKGRQITDYPDDFKDWVREHSSDIAKARERGSEPYFVRNNARAIDNIINPPAEKKLTPLEITEQRHNARTPEQIDAIRNEARMRQKSIASAKQYLADFEGMDGVDTSALRDAYEHGRWDDVRSEALVLAQKKRQIIESGISLSKEFDGVLDIDLQKMQNAIKKGNIDAINHHIGIINEIKKQEDALADLIPNAHSLHKSYSMSDIRAAYGELDGVIKKWLSKYSYSSLDAAPLQHLKNKLDFELTNPTISYSQKDIIKKALTEKIRLVNQKIEWNDMVSRAATLRAFKTKSTIFKDCITKIDNAIQSNDFAALQNSIAEAEKQQQKLIDKQIKRGGDTKTALNKEYKGGAIGKDISSSIDTSKMVSEDPYGGRFTNNVARMQGFDAPAKLVSEQEFDLLEKSCGDVFYRTVNPTTFKGKKMSSAEFAAQLYEADLLELNGPGGRVYGDGMYVATSAWNGRQLRQLTDGYKQTARSDSECYGNGNHTLSEMTWTRIPKIIKQSDLRMMWSRLDSAQRKLFGNHENTYACALGYDAMYCDGPNYMVIWNRSIIAVKKK